MSISAVTAAVVTTSVARACPTARCNVAASCVGDCARRHRYTAKAPTVATTAPSATSPPSNALLTAAAGVAGDPPAGPENTAPATGAGVVGKLVGLGVEV